MREVRYCGGMEKGDEWGAMAMGLRSFTAELLRGALATDRREKRGRGRLEGVREWKERVHLAGVALMLNGRAWLPGCLPGRELGGTSLGNSFRELLFLSFRTADSALLSLHLSCT